MMRCLLFPASVGVLCVHALIICELTIFYTVSDCFRLRISWLPLVVG